MKIKVSRNLESEDRLVYGLLTVFSILMTVKYFMGIENSSLYAGNVFQVIHPDAFAGDPYRGPETPLLQRPMQLSLMYGLVRVMGEIWLDDRFTSLVYVGLLIASLVGIDRIARLLGATSVVERLMVLLMFMRDHQILMGKVLLAYHPGVNHSAFAIPIVIWLLYSALARKHLVVILGLALLLVLFSVRASLFPIFFSMSVAFILGTRRERLAILALCIVGVAVLAWGLLYVFPIPEAHRVEIWELVKSVENNDANPFLADEFGRIGLRYAVWGAILVLAYILSPRKIPAYLGIRVVIVCGIVVLVVGGLYINFSPDALKQPLLISFVPARALSWPQNLAYIAITVRVLQLLNDRPHPIRLAMGGLLLASLFVAGYGNLDRWVGLLGFSASIVFIGNWIRFRMQPVDQQAGADPAMFISRHWRAGFLQTLGIMVFVAYAVATVQKAPAWATTLRTGVYGQNVSAQWVGIAEYFRYKTPPSASVLTFECTDNNRCSELVTLRNLATRSGRAMPTPVKVGGDFRDPESWKRIARVEKILAEAGQALIAGRLSAAAKLIDSLELVPDYIVLPSGVWDSQRRVSAVKADVLPYAEETRVRDYVILRRVP